MHRALTTGLLAFVFLATAAATPEPAAPTESDAIEQLRANVQYWADRGRADKVTEIWQKILRSDPKDADALAGLALTEARAGRVERATGYLERLERAHPGHPRIPVVRQALGLGTQYGEILAEARRHAQEGKPAEAVAAYRRLFGKDAPAGAVGLEFYQTLGGLPEGWPEALEGLRRLAAEHPESPRYALALARHLTYREQARREGVALLEALSGSGSAEATRAWRQALLWLDARPADVPLLRAYLGAHPEDGEVRARLATLEAAGRPQPADVRGDRIASAYDALGKQDAAQAEALFQRALEAQKNDVDALVGLATLALQREDFDRARELLTRVKHLAPRRRDLWERSLESADFWGLVKAARAEAEAGRHAEAEKKLDLAMKRSPTRANDARRVLAGVYAAQRRSAEAEALYRRMLLDQPNDVGAMRALIELYLTMEKADEALEINGRLATVSAADAYDAAFIESEALRHQARIKREAGDTAAARGLLDTAHVKAPKNRRVAFDLAYAALELGDADLARKVADELRADASDDDPEVMQLMVWLLNAEARYGDALEAFKRLPAADRSDALDRLGKKLEVQSETLLAVRQAQRGKPLDARHRLAELQRKHGDAPELLALVAIASADLGMYDQALAVMYDALAKAPLETPTLKLQLAAILHRAHRESELLGVLRELAAESGLTPAERRGLADLQIAYSVRRADQARERGASSTAYSILATPLQQFPEDPRLLNALGRLYVSAGEYESAAKVFAQVLTTHPDSIEAREGAIRAAVETGDRERAAQIRDEGLRRLPNAPRMHLAAARMAVLVGEDGEAMDAYDRALALDVSQLEGPAPPGARRGAQDAVGTLLARAADRFGSTPAAGGDAGKADLTLHDEIVREVAALHARHTMRVDVGFDARSRDGEPGMGRLLALRAPITLSVPASYEVRLTFAATPITLLAGTLDLAESRAANLFGTTGVTPEIAAGAFDQSVAGVQLDATLSYETLTLTVGVSPLGFERETGVGRIDWRDRFGDVGLALAAYRSPVTDSLLSYSGAQDLLTGAVWGGVTRNGGRLDLGLLLDEVSFFVFGGGAAYLGAHVPLNWSVEAGLGVNWRLYDWNGTSLATGLTVSGLTFDQNLRFFTYGQGGYFSPQRFLNAGVPFRWRGEGGALTYGVSADIGVNWFVEDASPFYPTDASRQAARAALLDPDSEEPLGAYHAGQSSFAFAFNASAELAYAVTDDFRLGIRGDVHTGHDYVEVTGGLWAGYTFDRKVEPPDAELSPFGGP